MENIVICKDYNLIIYKKFKIFKFNKKTTKINNKKNKEEEIAFVVV